MRIPRAVRLAPYVIAFTALGFFAWKKLWPSERAQEQALFNELVARCQYDREIAERLIEAEEKKFPGLSRKDSIERALVRLARDRR